MLILGLFQSSINFKGTSTIEINGCPTLSMFQSSINFKGTSTANLTDIFDYEHHILSFFGMDCHLLNPKGFNIIQY